MTHSSSLNTIVSSTLNSRSRHFLRSGGFGINFIFLKWVSPLLVAGDDGD